MSKYLLGFGDAGIRGRIRGFGDKVFQSMDNNREGTRNEKKRKRTGMGRGMGIEIGIGIGNTGTREEEEEHAVG